MNGSNKDKLEKNEKQNNEDLSENLQQEQSIQGEKLEDGASKDAPSQNIGIDQLITDDGTESQAEDDIEMGLNSEEQEETTTQEDDTIEEIPEIKEILENQEKEAAPSITLDPVPTSAQIQVPLSFWMNSAGITIAVSLLTAAVMHFIYKKKNASAKVVINNRSAWESKKKISEKSIGKMHGIGKRSYQQDSFGVFEYSEGVFAIVADGMGGLTDGDKVSQKIVYSMMNKVSEIEINNHVNQLYPLAAYANSEVNAMLDGCGRNKSGSTLVAVLANRDYFHWISIGDSRIYLFRNGKLIQMNSEHIYKRELFLDAMNQRMSFSDVMKDRQRNCVTSYVGMGEIKYVEGSLKAVETIDGDKVLVMSDGVFNTLTEAEICDVLLHTEHGKQAAEVLGEKIEEKNHPKQDNYTVIILDF